MSAAEHALSKSFQEAIQENQAARWGKRHGVREERGQKQEELIQKVFDDPIGAKKRARENARGGAWISGMRDFWIDEPREKIKQLLEKIDRNGFFWSDFRRLKKFGKLLGGNPVLLEKNNKKNPRREIRNPFGPEGIIKRRRRLLRAKKIGAEP